MSREIDRLVAENVMGWKLKKMENCEAWIDNQNEWILKQMWKPSTNIQDAWIALDKVCEQHNWRAIIDRNQTYTEVKFKNQMGACSQFLGVGETPMLAICFVALDVVDKVNSYG